MIPGELKKFVIGHDRDIRSAMQAITDNWREVVLVADDEGRVDGVVTDGDIRRGLLSGLTLDSPVGTVMTKDYVHVPVEADRAGVLDLMRARRIRHIPVIDSNRRLLAIHFLEALIGAVDKPNAAVIMAGGEGRRLRPLTDRVPKPMVPVAGRPILERIVLHLVGHGIKRIHISVNYLAEVITEHFGDGQRFGCAITYLHESSPLGTGGPLSLLTEPQQHPLLVMNGDLVTQVDVSRLLQFHERQGACATLAARHYSVEIPFGVVTQRDDRLLELTEKPSPHYLINAGIYVLDPEVLALVPAGAFFPITALFERLLALKRRVAVYSIEEDWIDVGWREELRRANEGASCCSVSCGTSLPGTAVRRDRWRNTATPLTRPWSASSSRARSGCTAPATWPGQERSIRKFSDKRRVTRMPHHVLGLLELFCGNHDAAQALIRRAIALAPRYAVLHRHLGTVLEHQGDLPGAIESCGQALALDPTDPETHSNMGNVLVMARRVDEAVASYRRAIELDPGSPRFKFNLSLALLLQGLYSEGWEKYEFRWDGAAELAGRRRDFAGPQWRGEPLGGKTILLHAEQAFGDSLQFARYAALVARRNEGARVLLECQPELKRLFRNIGNRVEIVAQGEPLPPFDVHCPLLSLPLAFGTTIETIPADVPYLDVDPAEVGRWHRRLQAEGAFKSGLVWSGKARRMNQWHNMGLADLAALLDVPRVRFFSLQKDQTGHALDNDCAGTPVANHTAELNDFADTAALICTLDLVISVDTAVAHLAGALGKPVWLLVRYDADWRWLLDRTDSPWYPSMRIFRQRAPGNWGELIPRVASDLRARVGL